MASAEVIKQKRLELGLSAKEFADALRLGRNGNKLISSWENGLNEPSPDMLERISSFAADRPYLAAVADPSFTFIDLFAGIGGIRIPFQELNGRCVFSSEWDRFAQKTYSANFGDCPAGDITRIPSSEIPAFDILLAGFPCQPFSQAGLHKGFADTRGTLFFEIERIISDKRPHAFLLENVKQLKNHDSGRTFSTIVEHLTALNYSVSYSVMLTAKL